MTTLRSVSEIRSYQSCPRKWFIRYVERRTELIPAETLNRGKRIHAALAEVDRGFDDVALRMTQGPTERAMVAGYIGVYPFKLQVKHDVSFTVDVSPALTMCGELDGLMPGGILERKTTSESIEPGSAWWRRVIHTDLQASVYSMAFPGATILYDVLHTPQLRTKMSESEQQFESRILADMAEKPGKYFARQEVVRMEEELSRTKDDLEMIGNRMRSDEYGGTAARNPDSCWSYGRQCGFFEHCWEGKDLTSVTQSWQGHELSWVAEERFGCEP